MRRYLEDSIASGVEIREYGREDPLRLSRDTLSQQKLELTSPTSSDRSVGIVRSRAKATGFSFSTLTATSVPRNCECSNADGERLITRNKQTFNSNSTVPLCL
jgi:hypothetical protein